MRGLVLEGGGAKGAFHCGAIKALYDNGYTFDGVAGTSIGAINGAIIAQDNGYERLYEMWCSVLPSDITDFNDNEVKRLFNKEISKNTVGYWTKKVIEILKKGGISTDKAIFFLNKYIDEDKLRESKIDFGIVTYCLSDKKAIEIFKEDIPKGEMVDYIFASAHYPAFQLKKNSDGKRYIDGGVYNNLPLNMLANKNYDEIIAIRTMSKMPYKVINEGNLNINYICPSEDLGGTATLHEKTIKNNIKLGYYDALRLIKKYHGYKYYIEGKIDLFNEIFNKIPLTMKIAICDIFKIDIEKFNIDFFNKIIEICELNIGKNEEVLLYYFEFFAKKLGVEKFKIYTQKEFLLAIYNKIVNQKFYNKSVIDTIKEKFNDVSKAELVFNLLVIVMEDIING